MLLSFATLVAGDEVTAPVVTVQAVPRRPSGVETDDSLKARIPFALVVVNGSARELTHLRLVVDENSGFVLAAAPQLPAKLAPFNTFISAFVLAPQRPAPYGRNDVVLTLRYQWRHGYTAFTSAQPMTASVELKRLFDEEARALPGGTASLFYLLLPLFPAYFAYQIVERLRRGEGLQVPVFGSEYLLPAFCIGLLVNYLFSGRYSRTTVLLAAAALGALWPALRWGWETYQQWRWGFKDTDDEETYLEKALLSPWIPRGELWVTAKGGGETWSGVLLAQPDGRPVLGPRLQVSAPDPPANARLGELAEAISRPSSRRIRKRLVREVRKSKATVARVESVQRDGQQHPSIIASEELVGFERQSAKRKKFVTVTT